MRVFLLLFMSLNAYGGYFTDHVQESITINKERLSYYRELTDGKSDRAIKKLMLIERLMLPSAWIYDLRASSYQKKGVNVMQDEFRPMNSAPEFDPQHRRIPEYNVASIDWEKHKSELGSIIRKKNRQELLNRSLTIINEYKTQPEYWCLTRHLVESIYRFAWFLPERLQEAKEKNVKSPEGLIWEIIDYHLQGFDHFIQIDLFAAPIQKAGIPMLCNELPDLLEDLN